MCVWGAESNIQSSHFSEARSQSNPEFANVAYFTVRIAHLSLPSKHVTGAHRAHLVTACLCDKCVNN